MLGAALAIMFGGAAATAPLRLDAVTGVYKYRFPNALVDGTNYTSEDILEVVKVSPTAAYVKASLQFYNGHICGDRGGVRHAGGRARLPRP